MDPVVPCTDPKEPITVTPTEIIAHRRAACWSTPPGPAMSAKRAERWSVAHGLLQVEEHRRALRARGAGAKGRRRPQLPNATPTHVVTELLTLAVTEPTIG